MSWDAYAAKMDAIVDDTLGDRVEYQIGGVAIGTGTPQTIPAFVLPFTVGTDFDQADEALGTRWKLKVRRDLVGTPGPLHRFKHPKLGDGWHRSAGAEPTDQGRYWLIDIQDK